MKSETVNYHSCENCGRREVCAGGSVPGQDLMVLTDNKGWLCWQPEGCLLVIDEVEV